MTMDLKTDFHMHTNFTDGESSVGEMIRAADEKKLEAIAITEHVRAGSTWVYEYISAVKNERKKSAAAVVLGFETKLMDLDGTLDIPKYALDRAELIICSLHRIPGLHDMNGDASLSKRDFAEGAKEAYIEALKAICKNHSVDIIGHPFDLLQKFKIPMPDAREMRDIAKTIAESGKAVEINTNYIVPPVEFIRICRSCGVKFSMGSDAHDASRVGDVAQALKMLRKAGGGTKDIYCPKNLAKSGRCFA